MNQKDALASLETIRTILERSTNYTHIAPAGIIAGGAAALAAAVGGAVWGTGLQKPAAFLLLWGLTFLIAVFGGLGTSAHRAQRRGESFWSRKLQFVVAGFIPPGVGAAILTAALYQVERYELWPGLWMICYGISILSVGVVLDWQFRATAWAFLVGGSASLFVLRDHPHLSMGLAFGGLHIVLGGLRLAMEGVGSCRARAPLPDSRS